MATQSVTLSNSMSTAASLYLSWADGRSSTASFGAGEIEAQTYRAGQRGSPIKCIGIYVPSTQKSWSQCISDSAIVNVVVQRDGTVTATHS